MPLGSLDNVIFESVPNISAGSDPQVLAHVKSKVNETDATLADVHSDVDHDRSVFTLFGESNDLSKSLQTLAKVAVDSIDITKYVGVHPRLGAIDVIPIVVFDDDLASRNNANEVVTEVASYIGNELEVPCIRYGLDVKTGVPIIGAGFTGVVRQGGIKRVVERIENDNLELIFGPNKPHKTAGITLIGIRKTLVAFNVDLITDKLEVAKEIAYKIRESSGSAESLAGVRALAFELTSRSKGVVQVSTNIELPEKVGPDRVLEKVMRLAAEHEVLVDRAELVGLAPKNSLMMLHYMCSKLSIPLAASGKSIENYLRIYS